MKKFRAQASTEYIFVVAMSLVMLLFIIRKFLEPNVGTVKRVGEISNSTQEKVDSNLTSMLNESVE
ncbi:hypothetical protein [Thermococcus sp. MAR1]|uniref:hypothetical protein n=1 Tax=Thermococcus sp. MAR1 TaxID=1638263 RepID=UPI00143AD83F|nr:hypothetical protein [Thermococcus sp. MAR1]NJE10115.1 hypothetical protein [Thermococcus sp. MAR1]